MHEGVWMGQEAITARPEYPLAFILQIKIELLDVSMLNLR